MVTESKQEQAAEDLTLKTKQANDTFTLCDLMC